MDSENCYLSEGELNIMGLLNGVSDHPQIRWRLCKNMRFRRFNSLLYCAVLLSGLQRNLKLSILGPWDQCVCERSSDPEACFLFTAYPSRGLRSWHIEGGSEVCLRHLSNECSRSMNHLLYINVEKPTKLCYFPPKREARVYCCIPMGCVPFNV